MACLEIHCADCDHIEFTNEKLTYCKGCGGKEVNVIWDEQFDQHDDDNYDLESLDWGE